MKCHVVVDFEASSLGKDSYPISIGMHDIHSQAEDYFIISPAQVSHWNDWDYNAERIHQLPLNYLLQDGITPQESVKRIEKMLGDPDKVVLISDSNYDVMWMDTLYDAVDRNSPYRFKSVWACVKGMARPELNTYLFGNKRSHNALNDARDIAAALLKIDSKMHVWEE